MNTIITGTQSKAADRYAIDVMKIPSLELMETASRKAAEELASRFGPETDILICCGTGNNGADGVCMGRILLDKGYRKIRLALCGDPAKETEEFRFQMETWKARPEHTQPMRFVPAESAPAPAEPVPAPAEPDSAPDNAAGGEIRIPFLPDTGVLVDAVFGIGLHRPVEGVYRDFLAEMVRIRKTFTLAVDVPSGINSDTGEVMGIAVPADVTVTFGRSKTGLVRAEGPAFAGEVLVKEIGIPEEAYEAAVRQYPD